MRKEGKGQGRPIGRALAAWCLTVLLLLLTASFLAARGKVNAQQLPWLSCGVLFFGALIAGYVLCRDAERQKAMLLSALCGLTASVVLLMIGFIGFGNDMKLSGLIRIVISCVVGAMLGGFLSRRKPRTTGKGKFVMKKTG